MLAPILLALFALIVASPCAAAGYALMQLERAESANQNSSENMDRYGMALVCGKCIKKEAVLGMNVASSDATQNTKQAQHPPSLVVAWNGRTHETSATHETVLNMGKHNIDAHIGLASDFHNNHQHADDEQVLRKAMIIFPSNSLPASEISALAARDPMSPKAIVELSEPIIVAVIMTILAFHIRSERRILRRRQLVVRVLLPAMPLLGLLTGTVCADVFAAGHYYQDVSTAAQLLNPLLFAGLLTLILYWWLHLERPPRQKTILAIGAHPDDIEFGCGATMLRLREEGAATYGLVLTGGECGHHENGERTVRIDEACSAAHVMALCDIEVRNFPDTTLHEHKAEIRKAIEEALERWRPNIIFTHNRHDAHTDHHTVYDATREAARGAYSILCYENPNTPPEFNPGYFFDVEKHIEGKIAALACHKTQMGKPYADSEVVRAMAGFRGTQARVPFAEGFEVMRVLEKGHTQ